MKKRHGFVTNSSSTNDIFVAVGTAGVATALGVIINTVQPDENSEIITYAVMESTHYPEEPRPPRIRVNDSDYVVWYYAAIRIIEIQRTLDEKTRSYTTTTLRDELDDSYTSGIQFEIASEHRKWLTFGSSDTGSMEGSYKAIGFMCESPYNDRPRSMRPEPPNMIYIKISANCNGYEVATSKDCQVLNEAALMAPSSYALNDKDIITKVPVVLHNKDKYSWNLQYKLLQEKLLEYCDLSFEKDESIPDTEPSLLYHLKVEPKGEPIYREDDKKTKFMARLDLEGTPSSSHIANVWDYMELLLLDEGLFFDGKTDSEGNLLVPSFLPNQQDEDSSDTTSQEVELPPVGFKLFCVVKKESEKGSSTATFLDMDKAQVEFGELKGCNEASSNLCQVYPYDVKEDSRKGSFLFVPKLQLPSSNELYLVTLNARLTYEGKDYETDIPIQLQGEPLGSAAAFEEEYRKLRIVIRKYIPAEQWSSILDQINQNKNKLSVEELRLMRRSIWETARDQLVAEAQGYAQIANICEWTEWGLEGVKWLGDQAFSYLMTMWTGPLAEMFITPFKDVMLKLISEMGAELLWNGSIQMSNEEIAKTSLSGIFAGFENLISDGADALFDVKKLSPKDLGRYLAAFAAVKCMNHYFCDTKPDGSPVGIFDAIIDTCKDLSSTFFKALVVNQLGKLAKSEKAQQIFEQYATKSVRTYLSSMLPDWDKVDENGSLAVGILTKYLSEFGGFISLKAYGKVVDVAGTGVINVKPDDITLTFNLSSDANNPILVTLSLDACKDKLFEYVYNTMFGLFPTASKLVPVPQDPTFYKS